ncbi:transmembrane protein, partial [Cystoisospora suis]
VHGEYCFQTAINATDVVGAIRSQRSLLHSAFRDIAKATELIFALVFVAVFLTWGLLRIVSATQSGSSSATFIDYMPFLMSVLFLALTVNTGGASLSTESVLCCALTGFMVVREVGQSLDTQKTLSNTDRRARLLALTGIEALFEMPDLLVLVVACMVAAGIFSIWNIWVCATLLTTGRPIPRPLYAPSVPGAILGVETEFRAPPWRVPALIVVLTCYLLQTETS